MTTNESQPQQVNILVTGGAGFIGSNIVSQLLLHPRVNQIRVLDNLATGHKENLEPHLQNDRVEFVQGDIRSYELCMDACSGMDLVCHQAALGSVPRSIKDPISTNAVNISGTLNIFTAAKESGINRVVYAASSSTYGDSKELPKIEDRIGNPISPYAVTKLVNEHYANVFSKLYDTNFIGLRYFNVFGPFQDPNGAYAAVIPLFVKAILENKAPTINGDGLQSRDFTFIENAVQANVKALFTTNLAALNQVYNIAFGESTTLIELFDLLKEIANTNLNPNFGAPRAGDVRHSLADINKARTLLDYDPKVSVKEGLKKAFEWYRIKFEKNKHESTKF